MVKKLNYEKTPCYKIARGFQISNYPKFSKTALFFSAFAVSLKEIIINDNNCLSV